MSKMNQDCPPFPAPLGLPDDWPAVYVSAAAARFAARYRVASQFRQVVFADPPVKPATAAGYSSLIHFFFTYSAWEQFEKSFGPAEVEAVLKNQPYPRLKEFIKQQCDRRKRLSGQGETDRDSLFDHLLRHASPSRRKQLQQIIAGEPFQVSDVAAVTRNAFFHGELTPGASGGGVVELAEILTELYLDVMRTAASRFARQQLGRVK